jgi:hypothetical protein
MNGAHDWEQTNWQLFARCVYDSLHRSYRCRKCGKLAGKHYQSHRKGWVQTKNWDTPCIVTESRLPLFEGQP